jgi:parallel beta-helix repeat protein
MRLRSRRITLPAAVAAATLLGTFFAWPASATQTTYYVGGSGCSDSGSGTQAQPFCTISKGAAVATAGQTVIVNPGSYSEQVTVANSGTAGNPVTLKAATAGTVTVTGGTDGFVVSGKSYVTIDGFTVTGTSGIGIKLSSSNNLVVSNNTVTFSGHQVSGQNAAGVDLNGVTSSLVTANTSDHNSFYGFHLAGSTTGVTVLRNEASFNAEGWQRNANGIDVVAPGNLVVGNVLHDNEDSGLQFYTGGDNNVGADNVIYDNGDHGIDDLNVTGGVLTGNTVFHNCTDGINVEGTSGNYTVENNVAVDNAVYAAYNGIACSRRVGNIGIYDSAPSGTIVDHNLVNLTTSGSMYHWGSSSYATLTAFQSGTGQGAHDIQADPKFVSVSTGSDSSGWNLHLQEGSAAIDSADSGAPSEQTADADGKSRVDDPNVANTGVGSRAYDDRGAYEFQGGGAIVGPTAVLTVNPASGTAPLGVTADASGSTAGSSAITSYTFDFGDGSAVVGPQAGATAPHTFSAAGSYTVRVTAKDANGLTGTTTQTVTVSPAGPTGPTAALTVSPATGTAPLGVTASASGSTAGSSAITSYTFDFGDGTVVGPQAGATASHGYANVGNYTATVTVADANSLTSTATKPVSVTATVPPSSIAYLGRVAGNAATGTSTSLTLPSGRTVATGDALLVSVLLSSTQTGTVSATDTQGDTFSVVNDITDGSSGDRTLILAAFGSRGLSTADSVTLTFPSSAEHHVAIDEYSGISALDQHAAATGAASTPFNSGSTPSTTSANELVFGVVGTEGGAAPVYAAGYTALPVLAISSDRLAPAYQIVNHTGTFAASGSVTGQWMAAVATFLPSGPPPPTGPTAALAVSPATGTAPLAVSLDASASTAGSAPISSYTFDFGDGSAVLGPQAAATAGHSYSAVGTFTAKVTVKDGNGLTSTATKQVVTTAAPVLTAALTVTPTSGNPPLTVNADASASTPGSSPIATYAFDFGDGTAAVGPQPGATASHVYANVGTYIVTVTVTDSSSATATATKQVTVTAPVGPSAALALTPSTGAIPLAVSASASGSTAGSAPITSYTFDFGDGSAVVGPQSSATAGHTYTVANTFTVTLTVKDANGLTSTATKQVVAQSAPPPPSIAYVGRIAANAAATSGTTLSLPVGANVPAGDELVVSVMLSSTKTGTVSATDTQGDAYSIAVDGTDGSAGDRTLILTSSTAKALTTADHLTLTYPTSAEHHAAVDEFHGVTSVDKTAWATGAASTPFNSGGTTATSTANELVFGLVGAEGGASPVFSGGYTGLPILAVSTDRLAPAYKIVTSTGSFAAAGSTTGQWMAEVATLR